MTFVRLEFVLLKNVLFFVFIKKWGNKPALCVKRDGKWQEWTFRQYYNDVRAAAKAFMKLGLERFRAVSILGFNSPEWFIADLGAIFAGGFAAGICICAKINGFLVLFSCPCLLCLFWYFELIFYSFVYLFMFLLCLPTWNNPIANEH